MSILEYLVFGTIKFYFIYVEVNIIKDLNKSSWLIF